MQSSASILCGTENIGRNPQITNKLFVYDISKTLVIVVIISPPATPSQKLHYGVFDREFITKQVSHSVIGCSQRIVKFKLGIKKQYEAIIISYFKFHFNLKFLIVEK